MPVVRYFLVMGCCLFALLFAVNRMLPTSGAIDAAEAADTAETSASPANYASIDYWRQSERRLSRPKREAIVYPDVAPASPTAERLQWERQLTYLPEDHVYTPPKVAEARAEMVAPRVKVAEKPAHTGKRVAHAWSRPRVAANRMAAYVERRPQSYAPQGNAWSPFGWFD